MSSPSAGGGAGHAAAVGRAKFLDDYEALGYGAETIGVHDLSDVPVQDRVSLLQRELKRRQAGGVLRVITRRTLNQRAESARLCVHSPRR